MEDYLILHNSHNLTSQPAFIGVEFVPGTVPNTSRACGPLTASEGTLPVNHISPRDGETKKLAHGPRAGKWHSQVLLPSSGLRGPSRGSMAVC